MFLPLAPRKSKLVFPYRLLALTVQSAQFSLIALPQAVTTNIPVKNPQIHILDSTPMGCTTNAQSKNREIRGTRLKQLLVSEGWISPQTKGSPRISRSGILSCVDSYYSVPAKWGQVSGDKRTTPFGISRRAL